MYKCYKLLLKTQYHFASIMHFLLLLPALAACTAGVPLNSTKPGIDARIVHGYTHCFHTARYQLSVHEDSFFFCGAVAISKDWALTAAHCARPDIPKYSPKRVRAGSKFYNGGRVHNITQIIVHDDYNATTKDYDIALLKVQPRFSFVLTVKSIPLEENEVNPGTAATVSGWGLTTDGNLSDELRFLDVETVNNAVCQGSYNTTITPRMICAAGHNPDSGTCDSDSGGPLVANGKLIGIVSWGYEKCGSGRPDVYTKISAVREWINRITCV